ncbi:MAG: metallophosphoesterase [Thermoplasmata archaeon]|nr:metallophosphoesterase [Thermoplasmata archaeon]
MTPSLTPIPDQPALLVQGSATGQRPTLLVADLHLGLGGSRDRPGGPPEGSADLMVDRLVGLLHAHHAETLLIAGDVKHPIVGTPPPLRPIVFAFFSRLLSEGFAVEVVLGNHDVGLTRYLPREVGVHPSSGVLRDGVGVFHGHCWPSNRVLKASQLVAGHLHPGFRLAPTTDDPRGKRPCWVRVEVDSIPSPSRRRTRHVALRAREIVILPPFNPLAGIEALNRQRPARGRSFLFGRFLSRGPARAYLLDGTDLGLIPTDAKPVLRTRAAARPPRGR